MPDLFAFQLEAATVAAGDTLSQSLAASEWLGPLAPIAISPFFGLAALSGIATFGPEWLQERSGVVHSSGPLNSPVLFFSMAFLAIVSSLPRFTKVSKPIALAGEYLESYSAIIIFIALRFMSGAHSTGDPQLAGGHAVSEELMLQAGMLASVSGLGLQVLGSVFSAVNIFVINVVKMFFEFLVWLVPFPSVDAALEVANKTVCVGLLSLYLFSPTLAMLLDLLLLAICSVIFGWCYRRLEFYRELIAGPILAWILPGWFAWRGVEMKVFCEQELEGLPAFTKLRLRKCPDGRFLLSGRWLWRRLSVVLSRCSFERQDGVLGDNLKVFSEELHCILIHRHAVAADQDPLPPLSGDPGPALANEGP